MNSIYFFYHPETNQVRYIGRTKNHKSRFRQHLKYIDKFTRHPFKCLLQSLYNKGYTKQQLYDCFKLIHDNCLTEAEAIDYETKYIHEFGIDNLCNIITAGHFGGDVYTNNPNRHLITEKLKGRIPWNKGKKFPGKTNTGSFNSDPRVIFTISVNDEILKFNGRQELVAWIRAWNKENLHIHKNRRKHPYYISTHTFGRECFVQVQKETIVKFISKENIN